MTSLSSSREPFQLASVVLEAEAASSLVDGRQLSAAQPISGVSARGGGFGAFLSQRILGAGSEAG
eukprot:CAMPEP_0198680074 /NCGR_PEP_ID=MMETSP1468-20131203/3997_1 /TAXON_ID=1461545 /ORGANISM="Mantoniella sp, Strain CCMP1436" /LENGTH=64 /DNA_ID=CAMNT_0044419703 /DNA_START=365 /DNA_END=554 /DNA_ORIENTATION=-